MSFEEERQKFTEPHALNSFILEDLNNPKHLKLFFEVYKEDYREHLKKGELLSDDEEERTKRLAREIIEEEGKQVCVVTTVKEKKEIPIGFIVFWLEFHGWMHSPDIVFHTDRVFVRKEFREQGFGSKMILRNCCTVLRDYPTLAYACFRDPFQSPLEFVLKSMEKKDLINEVHKRTKKNDFFVELNHDALLKEAESIGSSECFKAEPVNRKKQH